MADPTEEIVVVPPSQEPVTPVTEAPAGDHVGESPPPEGGAGGVVEPPAPQATADAKKDEKPEPKPQPNWKAEKYDRERERRLAAENEAAELRRQLEGKTAGLTQADVDRLANERTAQVEFNRKANAVAEQGKAAYPDFMDKVAAIRQQVDANDVKEQTAYVSLVAAAMETGEGARIIYELGANPDKATELLKLSQAGNGVKLGMELARMATAKPDPEPSRAPKPASLQVGGRGSSQEEIRPDDTNRSDKLSTEAWMRRRQAQIDEKRKNGERIW